MRVRFVLVALLMVVMGACATPQGGTGQAAPEGPATPATGPTTTARRHADPAPPGILPAPALRVTAFDGRTVTLDRAQGLPVVVSFFESWCPICEVEQPDLSRAAADLAGRVDFVGVSYHDTVAAGRAYQRRYKVGYPLANDPSGRTWAAWRVPYQPVLVLVDKQGRIAERFDGGTTGGTLRTHLAYLLKE
jgi:peroxiredoxin